MKVKFFLLFTFLLISVFFYLGLKTGSFDITNEIIVNSFFQYDSSDTLHYVIIHLRLPRLLLAFLVGGALSLSGYLMQSMVNNPLADPYILGTACGASLGASIAYLVLPAAMASILIPSVAAFAGAMTITMIAVVVSYQNGYIVPSKLLLSGVALSSLTVSLISFLIFFSNDESKLKTIIFWSMGSFDGARWSYLPLLGITLVITVIIFTFLNKNVNLLLLGESRSSNLGLNVKKLRWLILIFSSIITGFSVATSGPIGFVGLMVPHFVRGLFGVTGRYNLLFTTLIGGVFMLACDILTRTIYPPAGVPIGIITSFLGIPFFVYLLSRKSYRFN